MSGNFVVRGALVYDGLGNPPRVNDVAIKDGRIAIIAPAGSINATGFAIINAAGLSLTPGFIDVHAHSDITVLRDPEARSRICQGITTEIVGNCGSSPGILAGCVEYDRQGKGVASWQGFAAYAAELDRRRPACNVACLCAHGSLREAVMGLENKRAAPSDIKRMKELLSEILAFGAAGFSSGLWYIPGKFADTGEMLELASVLKDTGKPYVTHMRNEGDTVIESLEEAFMIARAGSGKLQISHLKTIHQQNWHKIDLLLEKIENERRNNLTIYADRYPYIHSSTSLRISLPPPYDLIPDICSFLNISAENRSQVKKALDERSGRNLETTILLDTENPADADIRGLTLAQIGEKWGIDTSAACVKLLQKNGNCKAAFACMSHDNMLKILAREWVCAGSDGYALPLDDSIFRAHPRTYGTFPLFFRIVKGMYGSAEAIRRMTSLPAEIFNIPARGVLKEGAIADMTLFDEETFDSTADFRNQSLMPAGLRRVFVAGRIAFDAEKTTVLGRYGKFLKVKNRNV